MACELDPDARALLEVMHAAGAAQPYELPVAEARQQVRAALVSRGQPLELHAVEDLSLPTLGGPLAMRLYRPVGGALPLALFLHGGGWTLNDLDTHDRLCRRIAKRSGWLIASLDYRRAPEHKHPAALEDALLAYRWLIDNAGELQARVAGPALIGESSGGAMAACLALLLRDLRAPMPALQMLVYPLTDLSGDWPSYHQRQEGYTLDARFMRWARENYVPAGHDLSDPYLAPLAASDLAGMPATVLMTAEFDPLRDEGIAYARKLAQAGVEVEHLHADDQMHGFLLHDRAIPRAGALIDWLADALAARGENASPRDCRVRSFKQ